MELSIEIYREEKRERNIKTSRTKLKNKAKIKY